MREERGVREAACERPSWPRRGAGWRGGVGPGLPERLSTHPLQRSIPPPPRALAPLSLQPSRQSAPLTSAPCWTPSAGASLRCRCRVGGRADVLRRWRAGASSLYRRSCVRCALPRPARARLTEKRASSCLAAAQLLDSSRHPCRLPLLWQLGVGGGAGGGHRVRHPVQPAAPGAVRRQRSPGRRRPGGRCRRQRAAAGAGGAGGGRGGAPAPRPALQRHAGAAVRQHRGRGCARRACRPALLLPRLSCSARNITTATAVPALPGSVQPLTARVVCLAYSQPRGAARDSCPRWRRRWPPPRASCCWTLGERPCLGEPAPAVRESWRQQRGSGTEPRCSGWAVASAASLALMGVRLLCAALAAACAGGCRAWTPPPRAPL